MVVHTLQANMTRGEVTPYVHARVDTEHYQAGMAELTNWIVMRYGGVTRCPGTLYQGPLKSFIKPARTLRFEFNKDQVYSIEAGDLYFRFWTADGRVESPPGTPVEVTTPYDAADLSLIKTRQLGDVIYIYCDGYQPHTLTRTSETVWTLAEHETKDGPYLPANITATTLTPASAGNIADIAGTASTSAIPDIGAAASAFDRNKGSYVGWDVGPGDIDYAFAAGDAVADAYWITCSSAEDMSPLSFKFKGFDGVNWITLDAREAQGGWLPGETRFFEFVNETAYRAYRLSITATTYTGSPLYLRIAELGIHQAAFDQTPFNLTASSTTGINGGAGFKATDVGRSIRLFGSDGRWRWARIETRVNPRVVTIRLYGHALSDLDPIVNWRLGAWSDETGWPKAVGIYEDRLISGGTDTDPLTVWGSKNADYDNHGVSSPVVADDAISARLTGGVLNGINWLADGKEIGIGTAGSLRSLGRNNPNSALGPDNIRQKTETITTSSTADPVQIENVLMFLDLYGKRLYESAYTYEVEGYLAREASTLNEHLFALGVTKIVYMSAPHKIIFGLRTDGKVIAFTYDREQKVAGASLVDFAGRLPTGNSLPDLDIVEDIEVLPGAEGSDLWLTVRRTLGAAIVRYYERLAPFWRDVTHHGQAPVYAACAIELSGGNVSYNSATGVLSLTGLGHLTNADVGVWAGGRDVGGGTVVGGTLSVVTDIDCDTVVVGKRMPARAEMLRLSQIGNQDGTGLGRKVQIVEASVDLYETAGLECGSLNGVELLTFEDDVEHEPTEPVELRTGMYSLSMDDSWSNNGVFVFETDSMYPATIRAVSLAIDGEP